MLQRNIRFPSGKFYTEEGSTFGTVTAEGLAIVFLHDSIAPLKPRELPWWYSKGSQKSVGARTIP